MNTLIRLVALVVLLSLSAACNIIPGQTDRDRVLTRIDEVIAALDRNSSGWQDIVRSLSADVQQLEAATARDIDSIAARGIAQGGTEFRCNADFIGARVKEDLRRLADRLRGRTPQPAEPIVCQVLFSPGQEGSYALNMAARPNEVSFYGYNFDITSPNAIELALRHSGGEASLMSWTAQPTHYLISFSIASSGNTLCNKQNRKIVLKFGARELYSLNVVPASCPPAPTPLPEKARDKVFAEAEGRVWTDQQFDREYGGECSPGYQRTMAVVAQTENRLNGQCTNGGWSDSNNLSSCRIKVHFNLPKHCDPLKPGPCLAPNPSASHAKCEVTVYEKGVQRPAPPCPACR